jgi:hypothetical protein
MAALVALALPASAQAVSIEEAMDLLKILATSADSSGQIACREVDIAIKLKKQGFSVDSKAKLAWACTPPQARQYSYEGKLVVCSDQSLFKEGGSVAFVRRGGKSALVLNPPNLERCGVKLPEDLLRAAVKVSD